MVITAVLVEGRSQSQVARDYGTSQGWISRLVAHYTVECEAAFELRSRRPHHSPTRLPQDTIDLIIEIRRTLGGKGRCRSLDALNLECLIAPGVWFSEGSLGR